VKNRKQACWIRVLVVGWWSTVGARGWSAWGYHLWRVNSSNRFWERNLITMERLKINQPVVSRSCTSQIQYSQSYKTTSPAAKPQEVIGPLAYISPGWLTYARSKRHHQYAFGKPTCIWFGGRYQRQRPLQLSSFTITMQSKVHNAVQFFCFGPHCVPNWDRKRCFYKTAFPIKIQSGTM